MGIDRTSEEDFRMSHLQDCIMEYLRQHPKGATVETIAEGIGSTKHVLWPSIRGLERWKMVESERAEHGKIWRAIAESAASKPSTEKPTTIPTRLTMCGDFTTIRGVGLAVKPVDAVGAGVLEERSEVRTVEKPASLDSETLTEVDRMLGEGMGVLDIAAELEMKGKHVPWTKIRARAAYLDIKSRRSRRAKEWSA